MDRILAFDPGDVYTGWVLLEEGQVTRCGITNLYEIREVLESAKTDVIVFEAWRLYPWKAREAIWSDFKAIQVIGVIKEFAHRHDIDVVEQPATIKKSWPNETLKMYEIYDLPQDEVKTSQKVHILDAVRHAAHCFVTRQRVRKQQCPESITDSVD